MKEGPGKPLFHSPPWGPFALCGLGVVSSDSLLMLSLHGPQGGNVPFIRSPTQSPTTASRWWESLQQRDEALGWEGGINNELLSALPTALGCQMIAYSLLPPTRSMPPPAFSVLCGWRCGLVSWWVTPLTSAFPAPRGRDRFGLRVSDRIICMEVGGCLGTLTDLFRSQPFCIQRAGFQGCTIQRVLFPLPPL